MLTELDHLLAEVERTEAEWKQQLRSMVSISRGNEPSTVPTISVSKESVARLGELRAAFDAAAEAFERALTLR
jgi:hypothetical protein